MRTVKLPAGRPLPAGRVIRFDRPRSAGRVAASLAAVAAVLAATACTASSAATVPAATSAPAGAAATTPAVAPAKAVTPVSAVHASSPGPGGTGSASCPTAAWAYAVTAAGKVAWHGSLPVAPNGVTDTLSPVVSGNQVIFAEGHSLVALRLSDGHRLWRHVFPEAKNSLTGMITFLYGFHNEVIALVGQVSADSRLVALSVKTGAVAWALPLGPSAVIGAPVVTVDSVFGFLTPRGRLTAVSLWTGKLLWSRAYGLAAGQPALAALGSRLIAARSSNASGTASSVTSFVAQTGKPLWTRTGMPGQPTLLGAPGGVFVYDVDQNVYPLPKLFPVTELNPANGKTQWRVPTGGPVSAVWLSWSDPELLAIATTGRTPRLIGADPLTRRVRWSAKATVDTDTTPLLFPGTLGYLTTFADPATLVMRDAADGPVRWSRSIPSAQPHYLTATGGGTILLSYGQATVRGKSGALVIGWTGKVIANIPLPGLAQAPPVVTDGAVTVLQLDTVQCATAAVGSAVGGTAGTAG